MAISIPASDVIISVKAIDVGTKDTSVAAAAFLDPVAPGFESWCGPIYAFLLKHPSGKRYMFDLGMRKGKKGIAPVLLKFMDEDVQSGFNGIMVEKDVVQQLEEGGVSCDDIDTVFWSHTHLDHIGDLTLFPSKTNLVVGRGSDLRTYPTTPEAFIVDHDLEGHGITELTNYPLKIGHFDAVDYFSDGSLYLLDAPGHCLGHINALVRVTPTTFVLLGGDTCHHAAQIRPNKHCSCPGSYAASFPSDVHDRPLLTVPESSTMVQSKTMIEHLGELDADPDIMILLAHDNTLPGVISMFPDEVNEWKAKGWKDMVLWRFLEKGHPANMFEKL